MSLFEEFIEEAQAFASILETKDIAGRIPDLVNSKSEGEALHEFSHYVSHDPPKL